LKKLEGYKTYITSGATIGFAVLGWILGYLEPDRAIELIFIGLGMVGIRHGITTEVARFLTTRKK